MKRLLILKTGSRQSRRGFTLVEIMVASGILFVLSAMVGAFLLEVTSIYYASMARSNFASSVQSLSATMGRDISSAHAFYVFPSMAVDDRNEDADQMENNQGGSLLVLMHVEPRYTTTPVHFAVTHLIAYAVDTTNPVTDENGDTIAYKVMRYQVDAPAGETWLRNPADKAYAPISEINQPTRFTSVIDYVAEVLSDPNPEEIVTIDANSAFSLSKTFIRREKGVITIAFGVIHGSGLQQSGTLTGHDIVSNTFNYSYQIQG